MKPSVVFAVFGFAITVSGLALRDAPDANDPDTPIFNLPDASQALTDLFHNGDHGPQVWPRNPLTKIIDIPYCLDSQAVKDRVATQVRTALDVWGQALVGWANKGGGHALNFTETDYFCLKDNGDWNDKLDYDVLSVQDYHGGDGKIGVETAATNGFHSTDPRQPGLNHIDIGQPVVSVIAHELGHVIGMGHEHQRFDRDDNVRFDCTKLWGYSEAYERAKAAGTGLELRLCTDVGIARQFDFVGSQYAPSVMSRDDSKITFQGFYDCASIMHFDSASYSKNECRDGTRNPRKCPLARWTNPKDPKDLRVEWIEPNTKPSSIDAEFVRMWYPWKD